VRRSKKRYRAVTSSLQGPDEQGPLDAAEAEQHGLLRYTIYWKENPCTPLVRTKTIYATDQETAEEAAWLLIFHGSNTVAEVIAVRLD
jgi:hypothetical protein